MKKHPFLHDYADVYRSPMQIIESMRWSVQELSFSNYHGTNMKMAEKIIRDWCRQNKVPLGPTEDTRRKRFLREQQKKTQEILDRLKEIR